MSKSVFISRHADEISSLIHQLNADGFEVTAQPMIRMEQVDFNPAIPRTDWLFFSSSNAVRHFFAQNPHISDQKFAAIGKATAAALPENVIPGFVGAQMNIHETAKEFAAIVQQDKVLFASAEESLRTVQAVFHPEQVIDLTCYRTIAAPQHLGFHDILVFSSPSNVSSFFELNKILAHQKIIAFGQSTLSRLREFHCENVSLPLSLSDWDIGRAINEISAS